MTGWGHTWSGSLWQGMFAAGSTSQGALPDSLKHTKFYKTGWAYGHTGFHTHWNVDKDPDVMSLTLPEYTGLIHTGRTMPCARIFGNYFVQPNAL